MAIETKRIALTQLDVEPNPVHTVTFSGASYHEHPNVVPNAIRINLRPHPEVLLVRFTSPSPNGKGSISAEFPGEVGQTIAAALLKRQGKELEAGKERLLSDIFGAQTDKKTRIGVTFADGKFSIPPATEVDIVTKIDIGL